jgi:hypothetical protein
MVFLLMLVVLGCEKIDPKCANACVVKYNCPPGEPNYRCEEAVENCIDNCAAEE